MMDRDEAGAQLAERFTQLAQTSFHERLRDTRFITEFVTMMTVKKRNSQYANKSINADTQFSYSSVYYGKKKGLIIVLKPAGLFDYAFAEVPYSELAGKFKATGGPILVQEIMNALDEVMHLEAVDKKLQDEQSRREYEQNPDYGSW